ncbi:MAG: AMP-binding protein [Planctomycetia bacterium]
MLHHLLQQALETAPDREILESDGNWTTAAELERMASRLASGLAAMGLEEGDRVALLLPNRLETVVCYLACFRMHLVVVPIDYEYHPLQVGYVLGHSGASILVVDDERIPGLDEAGVLAAVPRVVVVGGGVPTGNRRPFAALLGAERSLTSAAPHADTPAVMIYTSGTTSRPKGVVLSHGALATGVKKYLVRVTLTPDDVALIATSASQPLALRCQIMPTLWTGGRVSLLRHFTVENFVAALRRQPAKTFLTLTPASLWQLMASPEFQACDFSRLRLCLAGGDRVPTRLLEAFERLTGVAVTEQCGSTETGPYAMNPPFGRKKPGSVGLPAHGVTVAVVDEHGVDVPTGTVGDLRVNGPGIMDGYWNESAMTRKTLHKGWVLTGDLGRFDEDGYLWFMGRRKDIIVRDGHKIAPVAVEAALSEHPAVRQACVIGVPDAVFGELPHAYVILQPGIAADPEDLRAFVAGRLAEFMVPAEVHVIAKMPSKGPGKIDRELLRMRAIAAALIEQVPFFKNGSTDFLRDIIPRLDARTFAPGEVVVHEGDVGDEMYFLTKGQVEVVRGDPPGRLTVLRPGSFFGELAILQDAPRAATVRALTDVEVYALRRDAVLQLAQTHADFNQYLQAAAREYAAAGAAKAAQLPTI